MTASGDFITNEPNDEVGSAYPVVFGVPMTPTLTGILLALLGVGGAAYILLNLVQPEWETYQKLSNDISKLEGDIQQLQAVAAQKDKANQDLAAAKKNRADVLTMFANPQVVDTLLLDINRQIDARNAGLAKARQDKLAACPAWVRRNLNEVEDAVGDLVVRSQLKRFTPDPKTSGVIADNSYGSLVNNKLKRQAIAVEFEGNFNQTQWILRNIERLQPLLVLKNMEFVIGDGTPGQATTNRLFEIDGNTVRFLTNCQPESKITTKFQLEALLPLTPEELAKLNPPAPAAPPQ